MTCIPPRVLLLEDDSCIREALAECISSLGIEVAHAGDCSMGIEALRSGPVPMAVLVDLRDLGTGGGEGDFLAEMRKDPRTAEVPIISLVKQEAAPAQPVYCQLRRPFDLDEIAKALARLQYVRSSGQQ